MSIIASFENAIDRQQQPGVIGHMQTRCHNLLNDLTTGPQRGNIVPEYVDKLEFGKPVVNGHFFAVATNHKGNGRKYKGERNYIIVGDTRILNLERVDGQPTPFGTTPITSVQRIRNPISCMIWSAESNNLVCGTDRGLIQLYNIDGGNGDLPTHASSSEIEIHEGDIRGMAIDPLNPTHLLTGGEDHRCKVHDLSTGELMRSINIEAPVTSVSWAGQGAHVANVTAEDKCYIIDYRTSESYSTRIELASAAEFKQDITAHVQYNDHGMALGTSTGHMWAFDLRNVGYIDDKQIAPTRNCVMDPFVDAHTSMEYSRRNGYLLSSGEVDFSVWQNNPEDGVARIWSHSKNGCMPLTGSAGPRYDPNDMKILPKVGETKYFPARDLNAPPSFRSTFLDDETLLTADTNGTIHVHLQKLPGTNPIDDDDQAQQALPSVA